MKPAAALLLGTGALIALFYGKKVLSLMRGEVTAVPVGLKPFVKDGNILRGGIRMNIINNGSSYFSLKSVTGSVFVDSLLLADVWMDDETVIAPGITRNIEVDFSVPLSVSAALIIVQLLLGITRKKVLVTFDGIVEAEGISIPVKKSFSYG